MSEASRDNLVNVVVPVYNGARFLPMALDSVLAQTHPHVEIIAVDDGSTDDSRTILRGYGDRVRLIEQQNQGVGRARNSGIAAAQGEYIALLDQDDWWEPEKLARQVAVVQSDPRIGLVHTEVRYFDDAAQSFTSPLNPDARPEMLVGACYGQLLLENHVRNSSVLARRDLLQAAGEIDSRVAGNTVQDYDLWLRAARLSHFAYLSEPLTVIRLHHGQGTWDRRQMLSEEARLLERVAGRELRSPAMRRRMALLYDSLGVAHLDAHDSAAARPCFRRSLGYRPTKRGLALYVASCLPQAIIARLRQAREAATKRHAVPATHHDRFANSSLSEQSATAAQRSTT